MRRYTFPSIILSSASQQKRNYGVPSERELNNAYAFIFLSGVAVFTGMLFSAYKFCKYIASPEGSVKTGNTTPRMVMRDLSELKYREGTTMTWRLESIDHNEGTKPRM